MTKLGIFVFKNLEQEAFLHRNKNFSVGNVRVNVRRWSRHRRTTLGQAPSALGQAFLSF